MTITRRDLVAATGATVASALLSRGARAQSFPFTPNQLSPTCGANSGPELRKVPYLLEHR